MNKRSTNLPQNLLPYFPEVEPPVTLSEDLVISFSRHNRPLPEELISRVFNNWDEIDEYSELIPCFSLPVEGDFFAIVYWKGTLLSHEYVVATVDRDGILIGKKVVAGTISNGESVVTSVAVIDEDLNIYSTVGEQHPTSQHYNPTNSKAYRFDILPDGSIDVAQEDINTWQEKTEKRKTRS